MKSYWPRIRRHFCFCLSLLRKAHHKAECMYRCNQCRCQSSVCHHNWRVSVFLLNVMKPLWCLLSFLRCVWCIYGLWCLLSIVKQCLCHAVCFPHTGQSFWKRLKVSTYSLGFVSNNDSCIEHPRDLGNKSIMKSIDFPNREYRKFLIGIKMEFTDSFFPRHVWMGTHLLFTDLILMFHRCLLFPHILCDNPQKTSAMKVYGDKLW